MSRTTRVLFALFFIIGVIGLGFQGNAWANRLQASAPTPVPPTSQTGTLGDCAGGILTVKSAALGVNYRAYPVTMAELPKPLPKTTVNCAMKVQALTSTNLGSDTLVCWPILTTQAGSAYYYNGTQWVQVLAQTVANETCVDYVPTDAPNPVYVIVLSNEPTALQIPVTGANIVGRGRQAGTVVAGPAQIPVTGQTSAVGDCTWVFSAVEAPPANVNYKVSFVPETDLPTPFPALLVSCPVKVQAVTSTNLGAKTLVCWPLLPTQAGFAYYYDGSKWVKTTSQTTDNQVCADVVASNAPNPAFVAVFNK